MSSIKHLKSMLVAYKILPEPHYQAIGEHLMDVVNDIESDFTEMSKKNSTQMDENFIDRIDEIARKGTGMQMREGEYVYTISVTKIHHSVAK